MRLPVSHILPLAALAFVAGCGPGESAGPERSVRPLAASGPAADYPMTIGAPFTVDGTTYTPVDKLNYDAVGHGVIGSEGGDAISVAHKLLPLPSYAEVTSLETGRTILVRVERRGPLRNDAEVELSSGAAAQLGLTARAPVRVRRVNPPEADRALLRSGQRAPERMQTPAALLKVLMRRLDEKRPLAATNVTAEATPGVAAVTPLPAALPTAPAESVSRPSPATKASSAPPSPAAPAALTKAGASTHALFVQVAAFSTQANADKAAAALGGSVSKSGKFWLVRLGPHTTRAGADTALAKAKAGGYKDARILRAE